ncbi:hypermethylated in cancer 2 protein [Amia ocellicauda]|uniref:hypermethylated in cancer 2 protein n=1 Tax=Amia ocellicauda TaxID=2972642 RepID=UPI003464D346
MAGPVPPSSHAVALLNELNSQRMEGRFCDCVIRLQPHPEKLYTAHKNVLAASSPFLASLCIQGVVLELGFSSLTPEVMELLLEFIYTGTLPPPEQEDSVRSAAIYLGVGGLQQALRHRDAALSWSPGQGERAPAKDQGAADWETNGTHIKRRLLENRQIARNLRSPPLDKESESAKQLMSSCEVVPVIWHTNNTENRGILSRIPETEILAQSRACGSVLEEVFGGSEVKEADHSDQPSTVCHSGNPNYGLQYGLYGADCSGGGILEQAIHPSVLTGTGNCAPPCSPIEETAALYESTRDFQDEKSFSVIMNTPTMSDAISDRDNPLDNPVDNDVFAESTVSCAGRNVNQNESTPVHESIHHRFHTDENMSDTESDTDSTNHVAGADDCSTSIVSGNPVTSKDESCSFLNGSIFKSNTINKSHYHVDCSSANPNYTLNGKANQAKENTTNSVCDSWSVLTKSPEKMAPVVKIKESSNKKEHRDDCQGEKFKFLIKSFPESNTMTNTGEYPTDTDNQAARVQGSDSRNAHENDRDSEKEKEDVFSQQQKVQTYRGQVTYICLLKETSDETSDSENERSTILAKAAVEGATRPNLNAVLFQRVQAKETTVNYRALSLPRVAQPYQCSVCERNFSQRGSLNRHMRSHLGVRPYPCPQCPMTFSRQYRVIEHMRVHQRGNEG